MPEAVLVLFHASTRIPGAASACPLKLSACCRVRRCCTATRTLATCCARATVRPTIALLGRGLHMTARARVTRRTRLPCASVR
eukprot:6184602-Pleurochrysis_carterae.AAC.3